MRVMSRHHCSKRHRTEAVWVHCAFGPALEWVHGTGRLTLILWCDRPRVALFERLEHARTTEAEYRVFGCGPACSGEHELAVIDLDGGAEQPSTPTAGVLRVEERAIARIRQGTDRRGVA